MSTKLTFEDLKKRLSAHVTIHPDTKCWEWTVRGVVTKWYGKLCFLGKVESSHRLSYLAYVGEIPNGLWVLHKCDNPCCINPDHLFLGTHSDNMRDCVKKGRFKNYRACGEKNNKSKLKWEDIPVIKSEKAAGKTFPELAKKYSVNTRTIERVIYGQSWINN